MRHSINAKPDSLGPIYDSILEADRLAQEDWRMLILWRYADLFGVPVADESGNICPRPLIETLSDQVLHRP